MLYCVTQRDATLDLEQAAFITDMVNVLLQQFSHP